MTVKQLINELSRFPENLTVLSFSDNYEQAGEIEAVSGFYIEKKDRSYTWDRNEGNSINYRPHVSSITFPFSILLKLIRRIFYNKTNATSIDEDERVLIHCSQYSTATVKTLIEELKTFPEHVQVCYYPEGVSFAYRYAVITAVKEVKCSKSKKSFHDIMDHENYTKEVYTIDRLFGKNAILIYNNKFKNR